MTKEHERLLDAIERHVVEDGGDSDSFRAGVEWAFGEVVKQVDLMTIAGYRLPLLHVAEFIDKTLGRKE
jgi:hypothetical protein